MTCPLCGGTDTPLFYEDARRPYHRCRRCALVFVPPAWHLSRAAEKAEYDRHENDPADPGYRRFLSRLAEPLLAELPPHSHGLDFGCGPGPALAQLLTEAGHTVDLYDPFYVPRPAVFQQVYTFITASEVVEHLRRPAEELNRLWTLLAPGGILGIMTKQAQDASAFANWHYIRDNTHICFFSRDTFRWLADRWEARLVFHGDDVVLLRKPT